MSGRRSANLALAVHASEDGALERLVRTYQDPIFGYALRLLRDPFEAQEVTQDVFLRAFRALTSKYDEERSRNLALRPWLFCIARNLARNRRRSRAARAEEGVPDEPQELIGLALVQADPASELEAGRQRKLLEWALDRLDGASRELVWLRFFEEMSHREIAAVVGLTESAVRGKVFRALRKLRAALSRAEGRHAL